MTLRDCIDDGRIHLLDGAMGTVLYAQGVFVNVCYDALNITDPDRVKRVHEAYLHAGSDLLETNTFGANPVKLSAHGLDGRTEEINRTAARLAREVAGERAGVVGAIGPLGVRIEPWGPTSREEAAALFGRQIAGLLEGGVDGFILETFSDLEELRVALAAVRAATSLPVIAQVTLGEDGRTPFGSPVEEVARTLEADGADVIGVNCSVGPAVVLDGIERMAEVTGRPLSALPNAGVPRAVGDRKIYLASPEYLALYARRLVEAGARFLGGCCGTTPDHIRAMREAVARMQAPPRTVHPVRRNLEGARPGGAPSAELPLATRSEWGAALAGGDFLLSAGLTPPRGWDTRDFVAAARALREAGARCVGVADAPWALPRMGSLAGALILQREGVGEVMAQYTARGRRMPAMTGDLLGAAASGIRNVLLLTGDLPTEGPGGDSDALFDIDSIGLTNVVRRLNSGLDAAGNPLGSPTPFVIGVRTNPEAVDLERELDRLRWKVEAGADFIQTQPVFDVSRFRSFLERAGLLSGREGTPPVIAAVAPFTSLRHAEFLAHEVPGVTIPPALLDRMRAADERGGEEEAHAEGIRIAYELARELRPLVRGVHIVDGGRAVAVTAALLSRLRAEFAPPEAPVEAPIEAAAP